MIHIVAFTGPLADPGDNGHAAVFLGNVVDQLLHQHGFANAGAAEQTDLAAAGIRAKQVDDLDAGFQNFRRRQLFLKGLARRGESAVFYLVPAVRPDRRSPRPGR